MSLVFATTLFFFVFFFGGGGVYFVKFITWLSRPILSSKFLDLCLRRCVFVLNSLVHLALREAIVKEYCLIVLSSSFLHVIISDIGHF